MDQKERIRNVIPHTGICYSKHLCAEKTLYLWFSRLENDFTRYKNIPLNTMSSLRYSVIQTTHFFFKSNVLIHISIRFYFYLMKNCYWPKWTVIAKGQSGRRKRNNSWKSREVNDSKGLTESGRSLKIATSESVRSSDGAPTFARLSLMDHPFSHD